MKTKLVALALLMSSGVALAENWKTISTNPYTGEIFEIDLDSIQHNGNGASITVPGNVTLFFDCQHHYGASWHQTVLHIPSKSNAEIVEGIICLPPKPPKNTSLGCTNRKIDDHVPLCD